MKSAHQGRYAHPEPWARPDDVVEIDIDPATGLLPYDGQEETVREVFLKGTEPNQVAPPPEEEEVENGDGGEGGHDGGEPNDAQAVAEEDAAPPAADAAAPPPF